MKFTLEPINKIDSYEVENETVYDIEVEDDHSFCLGRGTVVHNSNCTTRRVTGVGVPQVLCLETCSPSAHGLINARSIPSKGRVCSDGGCKYSGDVAKAFVAGADFVMLGSMLAGCDESDGDWQYINGNKHLVHYGMSSRYAQEKYYNELKTYRASEGAVSYIANKGPVSSIINEILGGLRSCATYIGASDLNSFKKCGTFIDLSIRRN
jgi:GMP reductase